jgi:hypothetical protein
VDFSALKVGQKVEVEGKPQTDGTILAVRVNIENLEQEEATRTPTPTVTGTPPTAVPTRTPRPDDDDNRTKTPTVTGTPPTGTPTRTPEAEDDEDRTKTPRATPTATVTPGGPTLTATPTRTPEPEDNGVELEGRVGTVGATSFVLMTKSGPVTIQTDGSTQFRNDGNPATFLDVKMGEEVEVQGQIQADKSVVASRVDIKGN